MSIEIAVTPQLDALATRIERDVRQRGLSPGDRYITGPEVARLFGVSTATANRAMAMLAEKGLLVRRRRSGTFIGRRADMDSAASVRSVYVLVPECQAEDMPPADLLLRGIRQGMPGANVHFGFLPETNRVAFVKELLGESIRNGQLAGVVPISGGREVYRYLMDHGIPAVVFGSLYSSGDRLTSVDVDNREMARLLVGHLVERGHRRIAVIDNSRGCPGDNDFSDGVSESLASAGLPPTAALRRFVPDMESLFSQVRELLSMDDPPTGVVARSLRLANMVQQVIDECGDRKEKREIVFLEHRIGAAERSPFTHVRPKAPLEETAALIGRTLHRLGEDRDWQPKHVVLPVELVQSKTESGGGNHERREEHEKSSQADH